MTARRVLGPINGRRVWLPDYGDGTDGSPASSNFTVSQQTYQWVNYTLDNGNTITLSATYKPSIFRCQGTLTINGTINGDGLGHAGGAGGYANSAIGRHGAGPGGGGSGLYGSPAAGGGSGGSNAAAGTTATGGDASESPYNPLGGILGDDLGAECVGSGGGGGGREDTGTGGAGGAGGAGLVIVARRLLLSTTTSITLDGAAGSAGVDDNAGGGGGGSGGSLLIIADSIELPTSGVIITATAGGGGTGVGAGSTGGAGAVGRVYLVYLYSLSPADATSRSNPAATAISLRPSVALA